MYPIEKADLAQSIRELYRFGAGPEPEDWNEMVGILGAIVDALPTTPDPWEK